MSRRIALEFLTENSSRIKDDWISYNREELWSITLYEKIDEEATVVHFVLSE